MRIAFLLACLIGTVTVFAQSIIEERSACTKRCAHAQDIARVQGVQFYQSPLQDKYDIKYLKLDLAVETNSRFISGTSLTRAIATAPIDTFAIEFKNTMTLDSVFINGVKKTFIRRDDHIYIPFPPGSPLPTATAIEALFFYRGNANPLGVYAGTVPSSSLVYTAILSESYQAREWFPAKQKLADKIDSTDIWITTSATNKAGCNGLLKAVVDKPNNKKQYQWSTRYPMAYYHPSFAVGNYREYINTAAPAAMAPATIPVLHYIADNDIYFNTVKVNLDKTPVFIEKMSELFGLYPFKNEKYGHTHANIGGGMEQQTMSTMSSFSTGLIAHELGHQWFGNNVTCATWNHIWINEGFASYADYLMNETLPSLYQPTAAATMLDIHNSVMSQPSGSVYVPEASVFDEDRIFSSRLSYDKGCAIVHTLRFEMQSDAVFFQTLKNFQQQYKDGVATAEDFKQVAEQTSGKNFTDFFTQWYYGQGYPTYNVNYFKRNDSLILIVNQSVSMPSVTPFFKGLMEYRIRSAEGDTTVKFYQTVNNEEFKFKYNKTPSGIVVDPNNWVINKTGSITTATRDVADVSNEVTASPNPVRNFITLQYPVNWFTYATLYTTEGKQLQQLAIASGSRQQTIPISLPAGLYMLRLTGKGKVAVKKLTVLP